MPRKHEQYAAKLLFQFRVGPRGFARRFICEERIILLMANSPRQALARAKAAGKAKQFNYPNSDGRRVHFELVGVLDMLRLGVACDADEVWYDIREMVEPMKRRSKLLPSDAALIKAIS